MEMKKIQQRWFVIYELFDGKQSLMTGTSDEIKKKYPFLKHISISNYVDEKKFRGRYHFTRKGRVLKDCEINVDRTPKCFKTDKNIPFEEEANYIYRHLAHHGGITNTNTNPEVFREYLRERGMEITYREVSDIVFGKKVGKFYVVEWVREPPEREYDLLHNG